MDVVDGVITLMVVGLNIGVLVVVGARVVVVVVVDLGFVVEEVVSDSVVFVFLLLLSFLVFCVFEVSFSAVFRFHHFLF